MRKNRRVVYLLIAIILAIGAFWITQTWLETEVGRVTASAAEKDETAATRVLVARQNLSPGTILQPEHLQWQPWPAETLADAYLTEAATSIEAVAGAVVKNNLFRGEPIAAEALARPGEGSVMSAVLRPGYRAVTINVSASTGVAGFVSPGDRVDLILSRVIDGPGGSKRVTTDTVLRDVRVVGVDQRVANQNKEVVVPQTATVEVTPAQAELIVAASELGKLSLALRSVANAEAQVTDADISPSWLLQAGQASAGAPPPARSRPARRAAPATVEVVRGTNVGVEGNSR